MDNVSILVKVSNRKSYDYVYTRNKMDAYKAELRLNELHERKGTMNFGFCLPSCRAIEQWSKCLKSKLFIGMHMHYKYYCVIDKNREDDPFLKLGENNMLVSLFSPRDESVANIHYFHPTSQQHSMFTSHLHLTHF